METEATPMTAITREQELIEAVKTASTPEKRLEAIRELAEFNIEQHQEIYDRLAEK